MIVSGIITIANLLLAFVIGLRLVERARRPESGPEIWLAVYFLVGACLGGGVSIAVYSSLGGEGFDFTTRMESLLVATYVLCNGIAGASIYLFTWQAFRAGSRVARIAVGLALATVAACYVMNWLGGEFVVTVIPGPAHWIERSVFLGGFAWMTSEALHYWAMQRRRLRLGLADPVLCNRFLLWGVWATATGLLGLSELVARIAYVWTTGEREVVVVEAAMPIIVVTVAFTSLVGVVAAAALWLTFFPAPGYLRWLEQRHAARAA